MSPSSPTRWSDPVTNNEAHARASGRRAYNSTRQFKAMVRTGEVVRLLSERGWGRGVQAEIARELGVSRSTVSRDIQRALFAHERPCPTCGELVNDRDWDRLHKGQNAVAMVGPSFWLEYANELRNSGLLPDQDEVPVDDDLSSVDRLDALRRARVVTNILHGNGFARGTQAAIAKQLGLHPSTISRDVQRVMGTGGAICPTCERWRSRRRWDQVSGRVA
jgi:DNA-binding transcriptional regulator YdaS (Cro superfamily)